MNIRRVSFHMILLNRFSFVSKRILRLNPSPINKQTRLADRVLRADEDYPCVSDIIRMAMFAFYHLSYLHKEKSGQQIFRGCKMEEGRCDCLSSLAVNPS